MLPFCEWGGNIFTCVQAMDKEFPIYEFSEGRVKRTGMKIDDFFHQWVEGVVPKTVDSIEEVKKVINPFTGVDYEIKKTGN